MALKLENTLQLMQEILLHAKNFKEYQSVKKENW